MIEGTDDTCYLRLFGFIEGGQIEAAVVQSEVVFDVVELARVHAEGYNEVLTDADGVGGEAEEGVAGCVAAFVRRGEEDNAVSCCADRRGFFALKGRVEGLRNGINAGFSSLGRGE